MCICMYVCAYICMCVYVSVHLCVYVCVPVSVYVCICICVYICACVSVYACVYVYMYACVGVCVCVRACVQGTKTQSSRCLLILLVHIQVWLHAVKTGYWRLWQKPWTLVSRSGVPSPARPWIRAWILTWEVGRPLGPWSTLHLWGLTGSSQTFSSTLWLYWSCHKVNKNKERMKRPLIYFTLFFFQFVKSCPLRAHSL